MKAVGQKRMVIMNEVWCHEEILRWVNKTVSVIKSKWLCAYCKFTEASFRVCFNNIIYLEVVEINKRINFIFLEDFSFKKVKFVTDEWAAFFYLMLNKDIRDTTIFTESARRMDGPTDWARRYRGLLFH